jgi:hypothetical protein
MQTVSKVLGTSFLPRDESGIDHGEIDKTCTLLNRIDSIALGRYFTSLRPKFQHTNSIDGEIPTMRQRQLQELKR